MIPLKKQRTRRLKFKVNCSCESLKLVTKELLDIHEIMLCNFVLIENRINVVQFIVSSKP